MVLRFWRRFRIAPGVTVNLSKTGGSLSFGPRGAKVTVGPRGTRATAGLPGTGLFYTHAMPRRGGKRSESSRSRSPAPAGRAAAGAPGHGTTGGPPPSARVLDRLDLGFFARLTTPADEKLFVDGCRELTLGNQDTALSHFVSASHLADGAYMAGFLALQMQRFPEAAQHLELATDRHTELGRYLGKYGIAATMDLPITATVTAHVGPDLRGVLLGLVEIYQEQGRWDEAIACLQRLRKLELDDVAVKLSLAEVLLDAHPDDRSALSRIVKLAAGLENDTALHTELLYYRARALRGLGLLDAARDTLTAALRRRRGRPVELLQAIRYERALVYEELGRNRQARSELEKLYADAPAFEDVAARLGL